MRTILAAAAALFLSSAAYADTLDPLHGVCNGTGVGTCSDNGTNTPLGNSTAFGFTSSPPNQTGNLTIDVLIPNNDSIPAGLGVTVLQGGGTGGSLVEFINPTLGAVWNANDLAINFLGEAGASPNNPIGAYLPSTQGIDPGATGFFVLRLDIGTVALDGTAWPSSDQFSIAGNLPLGAYIVGELNAGSGSPIETASSAALLVNQQSVTPIPSTAFLFLPGIFGIWWAARRSRVAAGAA
jgi:hypothetical protein